MVTGDSCGVASVGLAVTPGRLSAPDEPAWGLVGVPLADSSGALLEPWLSEEPEPLLPPLPLPPPPLPPPPPPEAAGVTAEDDAEAAEVPAALVAVALKVYEVPLVRPATAHDPDAPVTVQVPPPGEAVTLYEVGVPPDPAETVTVA